MRFCDFAVANYAFRCKAAHDLGLRITIGKLADLIFRLVTIILVFPGDERQHIGWFTNIRFESSVAPRSESATTGRAGGMRKAP